MAMKNIELFDLYVGKVLAELYENFPLKTDLHVCELAEKKMDPHDAVAPKECWICYDSIDWLYRSGYIHCGSMDAPYGVYQVVLSAKGLEMLKATPQSIQKRDGIGEQIRDLVQKGKDEALRQSVNLALSHAVKLFH